MCAKVRLLGCSGHGRVVIGLGLGYMCSTSRVDLRAVCGVRLYMYLGSVIRPMIGDSHLFDRIIK